MKIPNDLGGTWRLDKFVDYQHLAPAVDPIIYCSYAKNLGLDKADCIMLAWYHSLTYCEITAAFLLEELGYSTITKDDVREFWQENKPRLIFCSARKYVKNMDWFVPLMDTFMRDIKRNPYGWIKEIAGSGTPREKYKRIEKYLGKWKYMGRFSIDLFTEALISLEKEGLIDIKIENDGYDWKKSSNLTSGLLNIFYYDDYADEFDRSGKITVDTTVLDDMLEEVLQAVKEKYPNQTVDRVTVTNKICSFRNLFKSSRYGGYHHDRQLENILHYESAYPNHWRIWSDLWGIRKAVFPKHMLGECNGWKGIRKERKKLWKEKGLTGVESSC